MPSSSKVSVSEGSVTLGAQHILANLRDAADVKSIARRRVTESSQSDGEVALILSLSMRNILEVYRYHMIRRRLADLEPL